MKTVRTVVLIGILTGFGALDPDPLLKDLRPEDLRIANAFHHAGAEAKHAVKSLLSVDVSDDQRERIALIITHLLRYAELLPLVEAELRSYDQDKRAVATPRPTAVSPVAPGADHPTSGNRQAFGKER